MVSLPRLEKLHLVIFLFVEEGLQSHITSVGISQSWLELLSYQLSIAVLSTEAPLLKNRLGSRGLFLSCFVLKPNITIMNSKHVVKYEKKSIYSLAIGQYIVWSYMENRACWHCVGNVQECWEWALTP